MRTRVEIAIGSKFQIDFHGEAVQNRMACATRSWSLRTAEEHPVENFFAVDQVMTRHFTTNLQGEKSMKRSIALLTTAAAALFLVIASSTPVALAQSGDRVIVPESSIQRPEDVGVRAHTNFVYVLPEKVTIGNNGAPIGENPLSLSCIYNLVKKTK